VVGHFVHRSKAEQFNDGAAQDELNALKFWRAHMFKGLGDRIKKAAETATEVGKAAIAEHGFAVDEIKQQFVLKKTASTLLLKKALLHSDGAIKRLDLNDDHIDVTVEKMGVQVTAQLSFTRIEIDSNLAQIQLQLASPPDISGANFLGSCIAWVWRVLLGGRLDSLSSLDGVSVNGSEIRYQTKADDLELLKLMVGSVNQQTTLNVDIQNHEIIFTAVEPSQFSPNALGIIAFFRRQEYSD